MSDHATNRHDRRESERFSSSADDERIKRDKVSPEIFSLKGMSLEDSANLAAPGVVARDLLEGLAWVGAEA